MQPLLCELGAPVLHIVQLVAPNIKDTCPFRHILQDDDVDDPCSALNLPGAQSLHVVATSAPKAVENFPTVQLTQVVSLMAPIMLLYVPAGHELHPEDILYETSGWGIFCLVHVPPGQLVQFREPELEYVPCGQGIQIGGDKPLSRYSPALH